MTFRTELKVKESNVKISFRDSLLFLGSCFADNMFDYFQKHKFKSVSNSFGALYHPTSILNAVQLALNNKGVEDSIIDTNGLTTSFHVHSILNQPSKDDFLKQFESARSRLEQGILHSTHVFITLGTAHVYRHLKSDSIVANCHKVPQKEFQKELLSSEEILKDLKGSIDRIKEVNPSIQIILTLSPVRYLRDGFEENQLSKSLLYVAIKACVSHYSQVTYFPSYEYVLDDLRDYRFYDKDLLHPNQFALDYIWDKLKETYFDETTYNILKRVEKINSRLNHKLFFPQTSKAQEFKEKTEDLIRQLKNEFPDLELRF